MTIALGIVAFDGVVLAADTEETMQGGLWKSEHGKIGAAIAALEGTSRGCLMSGAGDGHYIDGLTAELRACVRAREIPTDDILKDKFPAILRDFYARHVIPFSRFPVEDRPDIQLLIGYDLDGTNGLLVSQNNLFTNVSAFAVVGVGGTVATTLLTRFFVPYMDMQRAVLLAAYVMFHVKESVPGCGKATDIWALKRGSLMVFQRKQTKRLESAIEDYSYDAEPFLLHEILGLNDGPAKRAARLARKGLKDALAAMFASG